MNFDKLKRSFEDRFWIYGEVFDETALPEPVNLLYEIPNYYLTSALETAKTTTGKSFPFLTRYVTNGSFNAAACNTEDGGLVCIHASVPILLFTACLSYATRCNIQTALPREQDDTLIIYDEKISLLGRLSDTDITPNKLTKRFEEVCHSLLFTNGKDPVFQYGLFLYEIIGHKLSA